MIYPLEIRTSHYPADFVALAQIYNSLSDWQTTAAELELNAHNRDPKYHFAHYVAEILDGNNKIVVASLAISHNDFAHEDGKYQVRIQVHKAYQNQSIAQELWVAANNHLTARGDAVKLETMVDDDDLSALHLLGKFGFTKVWERIESRLEPQKVDLSAYADLDSSLKKAGIQILPLSHFDPATRLKKFYDLDIELLADVPFGQAVTPMPFERWQKKFLGNPENNPDAIWIAVKDEAWIALSSLEIQPSYFCIGMTGVQAGYRGLGVAKRLKLEGVRYALKHDGLEIRTFNDSVNVAMLKMNTSMGFVRQRSRLRFEKIL